MRKGFSLVEVMVALCILMVSALAFFRMHLVSVQARAYAERLTRATILGSSRMMDLGSLPWTAPELEREWHRDPDNPISDSGMQFYRFWAIEETSAGKDVTVYVAWKDKNRGRVRNFGSEEEISTAPCPKITFNELLFPMER